MGKEVLRKKIDGNLWQWPRAGEFTLHKKCADGMGAMENDGCRVKFRGNEIPIRASQPTGCS
jgi:hypothetical protein